MRPNGTPRPTDTDAEATVPSLTTPAAARLLLAACGVVVSLAVGAAPAMAHAEVDPRGLQPGERTTLTVAAIVERDGVRNAEVDVLVPDGFVVEDCTGPTRWDCEVDTATHAPHTTVRYRSTGTPGPSDVAFLLDVTVPQQPGLYAIPTVVVHDDGYLEPWTFAEEPFPAPDVHVVGSAERRYAPGTDGAACIGPAMQPAGYQDFDGAPALPAPCPRAAAATTPSAARPTASPTASPATPPTSPAPTPTPPATPTTDEATAVAPTGGDDPAAGATLVGLPLVIVSLVGSALAGGVLGALLERRRD